MRRILPLALALLLIAGLGGQTFAAAPTASVVKETLALTLHGRRVQVVDDLQLSRPLQKSVVVPFLQPANLVTKLPSGAVWKPQGVELASGTQNAQIDYAFDVQGGSVSALRTFALPEKTLWVLVGPGITMPIMLNQSFYDEGSRQLAGVTYARLRAQSIAAGPLHFNLQFVPPPPPLLTLGAWILIGGLLIVIAAMAFDRVRRRQAPEGGVRRWRK